MMSAASKTGSQTWRDVEAQFRRNLSPALFPSWQATCKAFGAAVSAGPGLVILVGTPGSGKTFTLLAYSEGAGKKASLRNINEPIRPGAELDLIDNLQATALARLTLFPGTRAVAADPRLAERLIHVFPKARIVTVRPMSLRDVHVMVEVRRPQLGLPVGYFTSNALTRMNELCGGNPRQLDALLFRSLRLTSAAAVARVAPGHVEQAALQIAMESDGDGQGPASNDREAPWHWLGHAAGQGTKFDQPWRPMRTNAPDIKTGNLAARRPTQPNWAAAPDRRPTTKQQALAIISARKTATGRNAAFLAINPAYSTEARPRKRRIGRIIPAISAVSIVAVAMLILYGSWPPPTVGNGPEIAAAPPLAANRPPNDPVGPVQPQTVSRAAPELSAGTSAVGVAAASVAAAGVAAAGAPAPVPTADPQIAPSRQAVAALAPAPKVLMLPRPEPSANPNPATPSQPAKEAARLLSLGRALLAINQVAEAKELFRTSAAMGDSEAAALLAHEDAAGQQNPPSIGRAAPVEHATRRERPAMRTKPQPGHPAARH